MAVVRNITKGAVSLWHPDAGTVGPGKETDVPDADFVDRAWPTSTWKLIKKPSGNYKDVSVGDAIVFASAEAAEPTASDNAEESA